jgi:diguanylate cyclase (GGDEF)-like protein
MLQKKLSVEELFLQVENLCKEVERLKHEKAELESLLEVTVTHADAIQSQLLQSNRHLKATLHQSQQVQAQLEALCQELQSSLNAVTREKADLEILLETTTAHGDLMEQWLHDQSIRDPLTGLFNRRYMEKAFEREVQRALFHQKPLGVIMGDIDRFQHFNNTFGHDAGDLVLRMVGLFLQQHIRATDTICRYGGEEIVLILPDCSLEQTQMKAEQLRQGIKNLKVKYLERPLSNITISFGVACCPQHGQTSQQLLKTADIALYHAKAAGRNCVVLASSVASQPLSMPSVPAE